MRVFELEGVGPLRTRLDVSRARGFSRFVGRGDEMTLLEAGARASSRRPRQVVGVVGEPGVGKSRLCFEFVERCRARGIYGRTKAHCRRAREDHSVSADPGAAARLLRDPRAATAAEARREDRRTLLLLDETFREIAADRVRLPWACAIPSIRRREWIPEARQRQPVRFPAPSHTVRVARTRAARHLDRRRCTGSTRRSDAFVGQLVEAIDGNRVSLVLVELSPRVSRRHGWRSPTIRQLPLAPLGPDAIRELLARSAGNRRHGRGRYAERIRRTDRGQSILHRRGRAVAARDGSAGGGARRVSTGSTPVERCRSRQRYRLSSRPASTASQNVRRAFFKSPRSIGKTVPAEVLKRVAELRCRRSGLGRLQSSPSAEFLYEDALYPSIEYAFKHPLTQEVAYRSQLADRRSRTHAAVARAIAELYPEQLDERAALLAHHWEQAGEAAHAAEWYRRAALWAGQTNLAEAASHWQKVRGFVAELPESADTTQLALQARRELLNAAWRTGIPDAEADALFAEARALTERTGDLRSLALFVAFYATIKLSHGEISSYAAYSFEALRVAEQTGDPLLIGAVHDNVIFAHAALGRLDAAQEAYAKAVALIGDDPTAGIDFYGISPC